MAAVEYEVYETQINNQGNLRCTLKCDRWSRAMLFIFEANLDQNPELSAQSKR